MCTEAWCQRSPSTVCRQQVREVCRSCSCRWLGSRLAHLCWACWGEAERCSGLWEVLSVVQDAHCWRRGTSVAVTPAAQSLTAGNNGRDNTCELRGASCTSPPPSLPSSEDVAPGSCGSRCGAPPVSRLLLHHHPHQARSDEGWPKCCFTSHTLCLCAQTHTTLDKAFIHILDTPAHIGSQLKGISLLHKASPGPKERSALGAARWKMSTGSLVVNIMIMTKCLAQFP